ncbi:M20 metallopeptidase family protein [Planococcus lenghuensis]|uniref:N-acyl-L-amino acid amidohydrolase n=1 Tax=Planococcus lenghuensis TaxID=2213202 RepID=A0A1Q2L300_9BACL|nr:amidohydrolase [Planococcus lenghuensis]AQQ54811.1 N-acyl-L-amino acid amidohydrolase [Planococcus lenghuensis]
MNKEALQSLADWSIGHRRHLHRNPELSGMEHETHRYIKTIITDLALELREAPYPSLVAYLPGTDGSKTIALRADIDALPVEEEGEKGDYRSQVPGVSHACGHDGHTAILLAVVKWAAANRESIRPNVKFIFQSAEEITPSGAEALVSAGVLDDVDAIFGIHLWQGMEKGKLGLIPGPMMASSDDFRVTVDGSGGHGSAPHETTDPIYIATHLVQSFQAIVSRQVNPMEPAVISVGKIEGGTTYNIIPSKADLYGTFRAMTPETRAFLQERIARQSKGICDTFQAESHVEFITGTPPLVNDENESRFAETVIRKQLGEDAFAPVDMIMGAEDFAFYLQEKPGAFIFVGMKGERSRYPHHHAKFDLDEEVFASAIRLFIGIIEDYPLTSI